MVIVQAEEIHSTTEEDIITMAEEDPEAEVLAEEISGIWDHNAKFSESLGMKLDSAITDIIKVMEVLHPTLIILLRLILEHQHLYMLW